MEPRVTKHDTLTRVLIGLTGVFILLFAGLTLANYFIPTEISRALTPTTELNTIENPDQPQQVIPPEPTLDKTEYATLMLRMANNGLYALLSTSTQVSYASSTGTTTTVIPARDPQELFAAHSKAWPAEASFPELGALLPFHRIVAYYGNFYSTRMGALGKFPPEVMKNMLLNEVANWEAADPQTPVIPAIDYIAMVAQADPGADGMYRNLMPDSQIEKAHRLAQEVDGILILEVQVGLADLQTEIERLEKWLIKPDVHLAIDPEFAMHNERAPGTVIGMVNAQDINRAAEYLQSLSVEHNLPPKILIVHRFTKNMVQNHADIKPNAHTQIVIVMDGWGPPANKIGTYYNVIEPEPVQFTGFKVFYGNDMKAPSTHLLSPREILNLTPQPLFIQYQ